jgi:lysophospholipase L1-like esterase
MKIKGNKKNAIFLAIIIVAISLFGTVCLIWFSYQKSQTVWQDILSRAGYKKANVNADNKIVFLGDSITFQEDWNVLFGTPDIINMGVSGNTTDDVLARLEMVVSYKPQKLFLMIGINDFLRKKDVNYVFANYQKIITEIRLKSPDTKVYIQSILPMDNDVSGQRFGTVDSQKIIELNNRIETLSGGNKVFFIDLYPYFCGADNKLYAKYTKDGLHLNSHGYSVWKNLIISYVK